MESPGVTTVIGIPPYLAGTLLILDSFSNNGQ